MKITTNNHPRSLIFGRDLSIAEKAEYSFGNMSLDNMRFFKYKGLVYSCEEFYQCAWFAADWDGYQQDSPSSGILVRFTDNEKVICGRYN